MVVFIKRVVTGMKLGYIIYIYIYMHMSQENDLHSTRTHMGAHDHGRGTVAAELPRCESTSFSGFLVSVSNHTVCFSVSLQTL